MDTSPLRICLVSQELPPHTNWGGVGIQFDLLARGLAARGHDVVVISRAAAGAPVVAHPAPRLVIHRVGVPLARKRVVGRTIDRLLHARAVARAVRALDRDARFDAIEAPVASLDADALLRDPAFAPRVILSFHGSNAMGTAVGGLLAAVHRADWRWSLRRENAALARAALVVAISGATERIIRERGVDPARVERLALGIDTDSFAPPAAPRPDGRGLVVGFVGRLEAVKGIDFIWRLLREFSPADGIRFVFKGAIHPATEAATRAELARHAAIARHEPPAPYDDMPAFFQSIDVMLQPSRFETFGLTFAEAMASGVLVFAGRGGAGSEAVRDGETGFLVDPEGPVTGVRDRLRALAADRHLFDDVRRRARAHVESHVSRERFVAGKEAQFRRVAGR